MSRQSIKTVTAVLLLLLIVVSVPLSSLAAEEETTPEIGEYIQVLYDDAGLLSNEANTILHSESGYIWVGSYGGLARYDSHSFVTYGDDSDSIMCGVSVRTLFEDSHGRMWIGSNEKGIYLHENGEFSRIDTAGARVSGSVRAFAETKDGIYAATTGGIILIDDFMNIHEVEIDGIVVSMVVDMMTDSLGRLWVADADNLTIVENGETLYSCRWTAFFKNSLRSLYEASNGTIYIGTSGSEIATCDVNDSSFEFKSMQLKNSEAVNCIMEDMFGRIWVCTDDGLRYFDGDEYCFADGIDFTSIEHIEQDYEGNLWLASSRLGVMEIVRGKFYNRSLSTGLAGVTVNAVKGYEGKIFAATDTGLVVVNPDTFDVVDHKLSTLLKNTRVRGLMVDSNGYLWITTYMNYGVIRYKDGKYVSINTDDGLASYKTRVAMELANGDVAVSSGGGVSIIRGTKVVKTYTEADGLVNPVVLCMCQDNDGNMYFGSDGNGVYVVSPDGEIATYTIADGLGSDVILNLKYDEEIDAVWVSTGSNLAIWDENGIHNLEKFTAGTGSIFDIVLAEEKFWILRNTSVVIATREQLLNDASIDEYVILGRKDGLTDITSNSRHYLSETGELFIATSDGIYSINTEDIYENTIPPQAVINSVTVDDVTYVNPTKLVVPASAERINIEFSALNYLTGSCQVEYQLIGADKEPIIINGDKTLSRDYTNLSGGTYTFRVKVIGPSGVESEQDLELIIKKQIAFHESAAFIIVCVLLGIAAVCAIVYVAVKMRTESLLEREQRYRSLTESSLRVAARSIDAKDSYTNGHSFRVAACSREIARRLGWSAEEIENVYYMALVHDIGKIGVPDSLLTKPSKLSAEEYRIICTHTTTGYKILKEFEGVPGIELGAKYHHERYDGTGYCDGLSGEDIPIAARVIAVADAYDAMASSRVYRSSLSPEKIRQELEEGKGTQFDPEIAQIMLDMLDDGFDPDRAE